MPTAVKRKPISQATIDFLKPFEQPGLGLVNSATSWEAVSLSTATALEEPL